LSKAPYPSAVRADPYCIIAHAPHVFFQTVITNLKTAGAIPAKRQFPVTDMATILLAPAPIRTSGAVAGLFFFFAARHRYYKTLA
jgi:hypothetical protein